LVIFMTPIFLGIRTEDNKENKEEVVDDLC
jgi:hypothetical protein